MASIRKYILYYRPAIQVSLSISIKDKSFLTFTPSGLEKKVLTFKQPVRGAGIQGLPDIQ
jgi:hypothetical protein